MGQPVKALEKVEMVYQVLVQHRQQKEVARAHRVSANTVSLLVTKAQKNKSFISDLLRVK